MTKEKIRCRGDRLEVLDPKKDKWVFVGKIKGHTLIKKVDKYIHFYKKGDGYTIQKIAIKYLLNERPDVKFIVIIEKNGEYKYRSKPKDWKELGLIFDEGHGVQVCLRLKYTEKKIKS